jgi:hypothetical protein
MHDESTNHEIHTEASTTPLEQTKEHKAQREAENAEKRQFFTMVATWLQEDDPLALSQLNRIIHQAGREHTLALLKEVLQVEEHGGLLTNDQSRRRTLGGTFFYLAKGKGYLRYPKKKRTTTKIDTTATPSISQLMENATDVQEAFTHMPIQEKPPAPPTPDPWIWEDRLSDITELRHEQGATNVKLTLIGRPGRIKNHGTFILTTMHSQKVPTLPKGLPTPPPTPTTYAVYIAAKQWRKVEEALRDPDDILIAEGYPVIDTKTGTIAVFVSSTATKFLQAAQREQQNTKTPPEKS